MSLWISFLLIAALPQVAIVIDDMGDFLATEEEFLDLPKEITFSFFADSDRIESLKQKAIKKGHEVLVHVPMEAFRDPSKERKNHLMVKDSPEEIQTKLIWHIEQIKEAKGINNHTGSYFTSLPACMTPLIEELKRRNLFFFDSKTFHASVGQQVAKTTGLPHAVNDLFLDHQDLEESVSNQLTLLESISQKRGSAIAIGHPRRSTLQALKKWLPGKKVELVPLSRLVR